LILFKKNGGVFSLLLLSSYQIPKSIFYFLFLFFLLNRWWSPAMLTNQHANLRSCPFVRKRSHAAEREKDETRKKAENIISVLFLPGSKKTQEAKECNQ
jgi:transposase